MLYLYSSGITPRLLEVMAREPRILPYLDMPMQHASDAVLARMRRPERQRTIRDRVAHDSRRRCPTSRSARRASSAFRARRTRTSRSCWSSSRRCSSTAWARSRTRRRRARAPREMPDDVPESVKRERLERLMELQRQITAERYERFVGRTARTMVDRIVDGEAQARTVWQADDVDGVTLLDGAEALAPGTIVDAVIEGIEDDVDFRATLLRVVDRAGRADRAARAFAARRWARRSGASADDRGRRRRSTRRAPRALMARARAAVPGRRELAGARVRRRRRRAVRRGARRRRAHLGRRRQRVHRLRALVGPARARPRAGRGARRAARRDGARHELRHPDGPRGHARPSWCERACRTSRCCASCRAAPRRR